MNNIKDNYKDNIFDEKTEKKLLNLYRSQKLEKISFTPISLNINELINTTKNILSKKVTAQKIIEKLSQNPRLSQWVKEGIDLHKEETVCQFCGNNLTSERLDELNKHFSEEFDSLINEIKQIERDLDNHLNFVEKYTLPDKARLFHYLQNEYEDFIKSFENKKSEYIEQLKSLKNNLLRKKEKPFESIDIDGTINNNIENEISQIIENIKNKIDEHNNRVNYFDKEKDEAKDKLILHYCAKFIDEEKYFDEKNKIENTY